MKAFWKTKQKIPWIGLSFICIYSAFWIWISPIPWLLLFFATGALCSIGITLTANRFAIFNHNTTQDGLSNVWRARILICINMLTILAAVYFSIFNSTIQAAMLEMACMSGRVSAIKLLILARANLNVTHKDTTLLMIATKAGHPDVVNLLIQNGAAVNATRRDGVTALSLAIQNRDTKTEAILRSAGAKDQSDCRH